MKVPTHFPLTKTAVVFKRSKALTSLALQKSTVKDPSLRPQNPGPSKGGRVGAHIKQNGPFKDLYTSIPANPTRVFQSQVLKIFILGVGRFPAE